MVHVQYVVQNKIFLLSVARQPYRPTPKHIYSSVVLIAEISLANHSTGLKRIRSVSKGRSSCTKVFKSGAAKYCSIINLSITQVQDITLYIQLLVC